MDSAKAELADKLKAANNILVTVSRNPSVDQLAACIGLSLLLNKLGKHTAAVFSGQVPSTIEFLQPESTLEKNTDSLRDFIIALDKSKADKLRYKVEDNVVRIFITPYRTSIGQDDLQFSQGDFNVDVVVALGVERQEDLDEAITSHGRILHDATVASINLSGNSELGSINWRAPGASSLSELVTELAQSIDNQLLDSQIATALLTGIVAETDRFSNAKTSSQTMSASAALMAAGANQQLVASKLEQPGDLPKAQGGQGETKPAPQSDDGALEIDHETPTDAKPADQPQPMPELKLPSLPSVDEADDVRAPSHTDPLLASDGVSPGGKLMTEAPTMGGMLTANTVPEGMDSTSDPLSLGNPMSGQLLDHDGPLAVTDLNELLKQDEPSKPDDAAPTPANSFTPPPTSWAPPSSDPFNLDQVPGKDSSGQTLSDLEAAVHSPHVGGAISPAPAAAPDGLNAARDEVSRALSGGSSAPAPIAALNAQPLGDTLHSGNVIAPDATVPGQAIIGDVNAPGQPSVNDDPNAPPPVPPPIPFQFRPPGQ